MVVFFGCGGSTSSSRNYIDMADYFSSSDMSKAFYAIKGNVNSDKDDTNLYDELISIDENIITIKVDDITKRVITINSDDIVEQNIDDNITKIMSRYIEEGKILYTLPKSSVIRDIKYEDKIFGEETIESTKTCRLEQKMDKFSFSGTKYSGNILKFKCIEDKKIVTKVKENLPEYITLTDGEEKSDYDISYLYMEEGIGLIAEINDDCIVDSRNGTRVNDLSSKCRERRYTYIRFLE
jgi:hypothetical protein